jgi:Apea-like HEPN
MPVHYEVRVVAWAMGGELSSSAISLGTTAVGSQVGIRPVEPRDVGLWRDPPGPPIRSDQLGRIGLGFEVTFSTDLPDVSQPHGLDVLSLYQPLQLGELSYQAIQAADLVRLVVHQDLQLAFIDTEVRLDRSSVTAPAFMEYSPGLGVQPWSISAVQAAHLPGYWASITSGRNAARIRMPLRRWGASRQRRYDEDKLLDSWIAMEGLFPGGRTRIGLWVAGQMVTHLNLNATQQTTLETGLQQSYRQRNRVAHGNTYTETDIVNAVQAVSDALHDSLVALL